MDSLAMVIRDLAIFCLTFGSHLYAGWNANKLFKYLSFQWLSGNVVLIYERGDIAGVFIAWCDYVSEIERRERAKEFHFNWQLATLGGDALMIADVIVRKTGNRKSELTRLLQLASATWPDWKMRRVFTTRRGKLVELQPAVTARFFHEQP